MEEGLKKKKLGIVWSSSVLRPNRITFWLNCLPNEEKQDIYKIHILCEKSLYIGNKTVINQKC